MFVPDLDMTNNNDEESECGLDSDSDMEDNKIYVETREGISYSFEPEYVNHVEFINAIMKSDITSGKRDNPINLSFISNDIMINLVRYIDEHKGEDFIPDKQHPNRVLVKKMSQWDIDYFNEILEVDTLPLNQIYKNIEKYIMSARYLMFDTFLSKLNCFVAHIPNRKLRKQDFIQLFTIQEDSDEDSESEDVNEQLENLDLNPDTDMVIIDGMELERKVDE